MSTEAHTDEHLGPHEHEHPEPSVYIKVAVLLAIVTAIEVGAYYVTGLSDTVLSIALLGMMVIKFAFVGLWFMHLRFDSHLFRRLFVVGIVLAMAVYTVVLVSFGMLIGDRSGSAGDAGGQSNPPRTSPGP